MANDYAACAYPDPWQILGVSLRPFSLGHLLKLRKLGCAYVSDTPQPAQLSDLLLGVLVCGMTSDPDPDADEFWSWFNRPSSWLRRTFPRIFGSLTPAERFVIRWGKRCQSADLQSRFQLFKDYIEAHSKTPEYWSERDDGSTSGAHWSHAVLALLVSKCGYTQQEAYNVPLGKALQDAFKWMEGEGLVTLMSTEESEVSSGT